MNVSTGTSEAKKRKRAPHEEGRLRPSSYVPYEPLGRCGPRSLGRRQREGSRRLVEESASAPARSRTSREPTGTNARQSPACAGSTKQRSRQRRRRRLRGRSRGGRDDE